MPPGPAPITRVGLPATDGTARLWVCRTAGGHKIRVVATAKGTAYVATSAADLLSSPTNGEPIPTRFFRWPLVLGEPLRADTDSEEAAEYWNSMRVFFQGPQAPSKAGDWGSQWTITAIEQVDLDSMPEVDRFEDGVLRRCLHRVEHTAERCECIDRCCEEGRVSSIDLTATDLDWIVTTTSGTIYVIIACGMELHRLPAGGGAGGLHLRNARITPSVLRLGEPGTRVEAPDQWLRPRPAASIRPVRDGDLQRLGIEP